MCVGRRPPLLPGAGVMCVGRRPLLLPGAGVMFVGRRPPLLPRSLKDPAGTIVLRHVSAANNII